MMQAESSLQTSIKSFSLFKQTLKRHYRFYRFKSLENLTIILVFCWNIEVLFYFPSSPRKLKKFLPSIRKAFYAQSVSECSSFWLQLPTFSQEHSKSTQEVQGWTHSFHASREPFIGKKCNFEIKILTWGIFFIFRFSYLQNEIFRDLHNFVCLLFGVWHRHSIGCNWWCWPLLDRYGPLQLFRIGKVMDGLHFVK